VTVLNPDHLFEQADRLISARSGGAPRQADLRRAISTVYYAVFHTIVTAAADDFLGRAQRATTRYALLYRSVDHPHLRRLCEDVAKDTPPKRYSSFLPKGGFGPDLIAVATAFGELQEKRYSEITIRSTECGRSTPHKCSQLVERRPRDSRRPAVQLAKVSFRLSCFRRDVPQIRP
jgi:hypothetical protein